MAFTAGQKIRAGDLNRLGQIVGRNTRTNLYLGTMGTRNRILSVRAPVDAGRTYRVWTILECQPTDANTTAQVELRYTTNDTEPTTSSTQLARGVCRTPVAGQPVTLYVEGLFAATSAGYLRVAAVGFRAAGTGYMDFGGAPTYPMLLVVQDAGDTVSTSGTVY